VKTRPRSFAPTASQLEMAYSVMPEHCPLAAKISTTVLVLPQRKPQCFERRVRFHAAVATTSPMTSPSPAIVTTTTGMADKVHRAFAAQPTMIHVLLR